MVGIISVGDVVNKFIIVCLFGLLVGCGGGSHGGNPGDVKIRAEIVDLNRTPIVDALVIDLQSGNEATTGGNGEFSILATLSSNNEVNFLVEALGFSAEVAFSPRETELIFLADAVSKTISIIDEFSDLKVSDPVTGLSNTTIKADKINNNDTINEEHDNNLDSAPSDNDGSGLNPYPTPETSPTPGQPESDLAPTPPPSFGTSGPPPPSFSTLVSPPVADVMPSPSPLFGTSVVPPNSDIVPTDDKL